MPITGEAPDDAEQRPAPGAGQGDQAERRVAAGDQEVDRQVIELAHDHFRPPAQAVVQRRDAVEQDQAEAVDRHADDLHRRAVERGEDQQPDRAKASQQRTDQVRPGIEAFTVVHRIPPETAIGQACRG